MTKKTLWVVVGPTAVGKTHWAIQLAKHLKTEIVSADSRQLFKELQIGTAVPSAEELAQVKHHFIQSHSLHENYNAGQYEREACALINELFLQFDDVVLCGGSGLYIKAVTEGFDDIPEIPEEIAESVEEKFRKEGLSALQKELQALDPDIIDKIEMSNPHRVMRALEVARFTGKSILSFRGKKVTIRPWQTITIGLELPREILYQKIDNRMDKMIEQGLFDEAKRFFSFHHLQALQTVGYREIFGYLRNEYNKEEAIRLLKRNSRRYAKRQLTWFKRDRNIFWFDAENVTVEKIIAKKNKEATPTEPPL
ncbi:MAG: tRNA (adenosine(37)-N6)-dimethylallyltransferase MiaA [Flavobacterium sp.]|jgi:tRNA dimethylallyltransferase|nr:tRNA (adenosine(37)-N6)-dimethylallyltransferase MiaA [Flavobacterium sp.]MCU0393569.1 tRNA (adenosine(37)-N6)-dimethylallyltransferase MiaA [Thermoflexibacter sp.]